MTRERQILFWVVLIAAFVTLLSLLSGVLMPFVAGMAVAYFLDPLADKLEKAGASRALAAALIIFAFFATAVGVAVLLFPLLQGQVAVLLSHIPDLVQSLRDLAEPFIRQVWADLPADAVQKIQDAAGSFAGDAVQWMGGMLAGLWSGGLAFFNLLSLILITPLVAFYLLRDWNRIVARLDGLLPRDFAPVIREQAREIDKTIAGFVRGQASLCLVLAAYYGLGLTLVGLQSGLLVGIGAGVISFIPYIGASVGLVVGVGIALAQFSDWTPIVLVAAVFLAGQTAESYLLTPKLVGERVGLSPIWIIFALLAGGALFGLTGVLLAVPISAVIGVLVRFSLKRYRESRLFLGDGDGGA